MNFSDRLHRLDVMILILAMSGFCSLGVTRADDVEKSSEGKAELSAEHVERVRQGTALFKSSVRSILTEHCLDCHGGESTKADFSLASQAELMASGFVGDDAEDSYLFELVTHQAEPHMPLQADRLPDKKIQLIRKWLDLGAPYDRPLAESTIENNHQERVISREDRQFWSFLPLKQVEPPKVTNQAWCRTPIDQFILSEQESRGLSGRPLADARVLLRRASLDLLGLPPEPAEIASFQQNFSHLVWENWLKKLLDSPHYGERWARHWMDVARFAESHGYEQDYDRPHAYHYRDFLIRAFNDDMPFDQFVRWQLAGDEFAPDNPMAMMATGFLGAGVFPTQLTEAEFESARYDELDDMVTTTGVAFLGLSVGCARCHDHKFDPITASDYYSMANNFTSTIRCELDLELNPLANQKREQEWKVSLQNSKRELANFEREPLIESFSEWLSEFDPSTSESKWKLLEVESVASDAGSRYEMQDDGSWLAVGPTPAKEVITITGRSNLESVNQLRLEALAHPDLPASGPGRAENGNFALGDLQLFVAQETTDLSTLTSVEKEPREVAFGQAEATHQQDKGSLSVAASIDQDPISGWAVDRGGIGSNQAAVFHFQKIQTFSHESRWTIRMTFQHPNRKHVIGRFRFSLSGHDEAPLAVGFEGLADETKRAIEQCMQAPDPDSVAWKTALNWYKRTLPEWKERFESVRKLESTGPSLKLTKVMLSSEGVPHMKHHADGRGYPHFYPKTFVLKRGDVEQKQEEAELGFLQVLTPENKSFDDWYMDESSSEKHHSNRRSALARWMTDVDEGAGALVARVIVNRLWQHHFGTGLVATPNDFGLSGSKPSHPALLDWLAGELIANQWRLKPIHQLIMTSRVYIQSSDGDSLRLEQDPENRWLTRWAPRRVEAEVIRDSMLAISGQLDRTMFGPGTLNESMNRRSIYFFIKRSQLIPTMMLFDWPEHLVSIGQRSQTTVAPQALMFLNSPQGRRYAEALSRRLEGDSAEEKIREAYDLALSREPTDREQRLCVDFFRQQEEGYVEQGHASPFDSACVDFCQMLFGMNELVYLE